MRLTHALTRPLAAALATAFTATAFTATASFADVTIGVSIPLTGPTSALGIPSKNGITCGRKPSPAKRSK